MRNAHWRFVHVDCGEAILPNLKSKIIVHKLEVHSLILLLPSRLPVIHKVSFESNNTSRGSVVACIVGSEFMNVIVTAENSEYVETV